VPAYEANVLDRFADLYDKKMIQRGSRPVFWSVNQQRILSEDDFVQ
jgi:isoleucyl-tRNA synthetase